MRKAARITKQKYFTLMVVPPNSAGPAFSLKIPQWLVVSCLGVFVFSLFTLGTTLLYSSFLSRKFFSYQTLRAENLQQKKTISLFKEKTTLIKTEIESLSKKDLELRKMLGLKIDKELLKPITADSNLPSIEKGVKEEKGRLENLMRKVTKIRQRYSATPSIWPVYGSIQSFFGYRSHPWKGFHSGTDITCSYNTPVRVAASGTVSYAGWRSGYGKTVIVNHGYNTETLYGHLASFKVRPGAVVLKADIIGNVGMTGYTTGPHLHYEIRKFGVAVNPVSYLNLDIFTASKIWNYEEGKL